LVVAPSASEKPPAASGNAVLLPRPRRIEATHL
jgi:hypothetical protein